MDQKYIFVMARVLRGFRILRRLVHRKLRQGFGEFNEAIIPKIRPALRVYGPALAIRFSQLQTLFYAVYALVDALFAHRNRRITRHSSTGVITEHRFPEITILDPHPGIAHLCERRSALQLAPFRNGDPFDWAPERPSHYSCPPLRSDISRSDSPKGSSTHGPPIRTSLKLAPPSTTLAHLQMEKLRLTNLYEL
ncbi:hypothetical protein CYLTODRAFT_460382 [Cylindrobasidium torrendii FP15055 ss-10]|uniref:Uncharacterized protein n=1 Tax=Cylindrobasidium torrendii FP15055 ss-10 TaxID=1314674 RepID=A0A0D7AS39_9AGAR|nr:hypothetical protein CYLTODRAFT_460382 [Cylindrobasidium torrendii FP15055 ss-10]